MVTRRERVLRRLFRPLERLGLHVTPVHFYQPVPDTGRLPESLWAEPSALVGVDWNAEGQLARLEDFQEHFRDEYTAFAVGATSDPTEFHLDNEQFSKVDAEALYCMVRQLRPQRVIEIGSGNSTLLTARAIRVNASEDPTYRCRFTAIEPYPNEVISRGVDGLTELMAKPVQEVGPDVFAELGENDLLFIDSSHVLKIGSDVQYEFLEVLPRLAAGVVVQIHDVFLPNEYPRHLVLDWHQFWTEQYLVQAFLSFNTSFEVLWSSAWLHARHPDLLAAAFPSYRGIGWPTGLPPSSLWLRRTA
ncbi:MAG: hypothetical protein QOH79_223 [Acidimicrobiaceae bacterium]|jgi:predicted O-methyltransferase YrrM